MKLRLIPPGEYMMGSHDHEEAYKEAEGPRHRVRLTRPCYLGTCGVTQGECVQVMGINPSSYSPKPGEGQPKGIGQFTPRQLRIVASRRGFLQLTQRTGRTSASPRRQVSPLSAIWEA
jgi:formylglycine-generating enzyme required for sulfatase activity